MSKGPVEEFALDGAGSSGGESSAGPGSSGHGPAGPDGRRRSARGWWRSPGSWVAVAVVLVVVGAAVSPQGEPLEPRPPDTAWTASAPTPGRAPGLWMLADRPIVAGADGLTAFEPATGETAWTAALDDPACTATTDTLTCVHGEGESARLATVSANGQVSEQPFPHADVAVSAGEDLIVAGGTAGENPWFGRFTVASGSPEPVWQYSDDYFNGPSVRWQDANISQGIVTVSSDAEETVVDSAGQFDGRANLAADLETGEPRPAVVYSSGSRSTSTSAVVDDEWDQIVLPLSGPEATVPGYPEAVFTSRGVFDSYGGDRILEYLGEPLLAVGDDIIITRVQSDATTIPEPGEEMDLAMQTERLDVRTGETQWQLDRDQLLGCPCASSLDTIVVTGSSVTMSERFITSPVALLGVDLESGRHEWTLPISTRPDAIAAGGDHVYVRTGGTLAAYENG